MAPRERAIEIIEECRDIHVQWADWQESDPDWRDQIQAEGKNSPGGPEHHREWVAKYDEVLEVLASDQEIAWAAGFFDGEGCISTQTQKSRKYVRVTVTQCDRRPLERFVAAIGFGQVRGPHPMPGNRLGRYSVGYYKDADRVIDILWPYLSAPKREQATQKRYDASLTPRGRS